MADNALQEVIFPFAGKIFRVRPTYKILARIEAVTGVPVRTLGFRCYSAGVPIASRTVQEISLGEVSTIMTIILDGRDGAPDPETIGDTLVDDGYLELLNPLGNFLIRAQTGNKEYEAQQRRIAEAAEKEASAEKAAANPPTLAAEETDHHPV